MWPENIKEKDINEMIMSGINVQDIINENTYQGLELHLKFSKWKKI